MKLTRTEYGYTVSHNGYGYCIIKSADPYYTGWDIQVFHEGHSEFLCFPSVTLADAKKRIESGSAAFEFEGWVEERERNFAGQFED